MTDHELVTEVVDTALKKFRCNADAGDDRMVIGRHDLFYLIYRVLKQRKAIPDD